MARHPRQEEHGAIHHVVVKGSGGESIVRDNVDRFTFIRDVGEATKRHEWICLAYCLLDSHGHLLVMTPLANLGRGMQWLLARYARTFNKRHTREGNLFHTRFYSTRVESAEHLSSALIYVYLNPVRAGLVERAESWAWCSYGATIGVAGPPDFLGVDAALALIDPRREPAQRQLQFAVAEAIGRDRARAAVRYGV